ncbi:MAG: glycosyltransferase family 2 protein [Desulfobacteraceae bacterium]|nr:glycosyltransferase family 2 protein [Desulfobacteraceae bacterium]
MLTVVIPALNEEKAILKTIENIKSALKKHNIEHEVIVVNDGSTDKTGKIAEEYGAKVIHHPKPGGYGLSLKDGIMAAHHDIIAITDADGTYPTDRLPDLYNIVVEQGFDMAVGARTGSEYRGTFLKMPARRVFLWLSEYAAGQKIDDINSGLRVFKKEIALKYMPAIGNKFSFTTTITLVALLEGYFVKYIPIDYYKRVGKSHVKYWRDSLRSLQIIVENILYFNPLKLFLLLINIMLGTSLVSFVIYIFSDSAKLSFFSGCLAVFCFATAFIIAAIGLSTDLNRINAKFSKSCHHTNQSKSDRLNTR